MALQRKLPVGIENFEEMRAEDFYYVDKTGFIRELLLSWGKVNLFTRPRRFGKTLNMDMLRAFFRIGGDKALFKGLAISAEKELCAQYQGQFPVIFLSLKSVSGPSFETALKRMEGVIRAEARRLQFLLESERLSAIDKQALSAFYQENMSAERQEESLFVFSEMLHRHYGKKAIILIDEYDVPLDKAYEHGYYDEMLEHIRALLEMALKTNENLQFAVVTGCLRISRESIFTGLNNFSVHTISDAMYDEYFGFTDSEVSRLLADYGMPDKYPEVRSWYDGYRFGQASIYCPWDVLNYVREHLADPDAPAAAYWANSSGNAIVRGLLRQAGGTAKAQVEQLISGETVSMQLAEEMTDHDLETPDPAQRLRYLWSIMYTTGYLTDAAQPSGRLHRLKIPNREVQEIFEQQIYGWFAEEAGKNQAAIRGLGEAFCAGDAQEVERRLNAYLQLAVSIRDTCAQTSKKENFYHGLLLGLLNADETLAVRSNEESGLGYSDILLEDPVLGVGCVLELKYAEGGKYDSACCRALAQIEQRDYACKLREDGMQTIYKYGIAFWRKACRVQRAEE